jgi:hypothetical protein
LVYYVHGVYAHKDIPKLLYAYRNFKNTKIFWKSDSCALSKSKKVCIY